MKYLSYHRTRMHPDLICLWGVQMLTMLFHKENDSEQLLELRDELYGSKSLNGIVRVIFFKLTDDN
jgi:hypothetical protein